MSTCGFSDIPPRLLHVYRMTRYRAADIGIRVGQRAPDELFALVGSSNATLLTAWNPQSRRRPDGWNRRMQQRLRQRMRRLIVVEADGTLHRWREEMLLVAGDPRKIVLLAVGFRQRAVVVARRGQRVVLRLIR